MLVQQEANLDLGTSALHDLPHRFSSSSNDFPSLGSIQAADESSEAGQLTQNFESSQPLFQAPRVWNLLFLPPKKCHKHAYKKGFSQLTNAPAPAETGGPPPGPILAQNPEASTVALAGNPGLLSPWVDTNMLPLGQHWLALILQNCAISKLAVADLSTTHSELRPYLNFHPSNAPQVKLIQKHSTL